MTVVRDEARRVFTSVVACKQCQAAIYWSRTGAGKRAAFNVDAEGEPTRVLHSTTCLAARDQPA